MEGQFLAIRGEFEPARVLMDESLQLCRELGIWLGESECCEARGRLEALAGDHASAERWIRRSFEEQLARGEHGHASTVGLWLSEVLVDRGKLEEGEDLIKQCTDLSVSDDVLDLGLAAVGRARLSLARGEGPAALAEARGAVSIFENTEMPREHGDALVALADALALTGDRNGARATAASALQLYEQKGALVSAERTRRLRERSSRAR